jgi:hypothetical protein
MGNVRTAMDDVRLAYSEVLEAAGTETQTMGAEFATIWAMDPSGGDGLVFLPACRVVDSLSKLGYGLVTPAPPLPLLPPHLAGVVPWRVWVKVMETSVALEVQFVGDASGSSKVVGSEAVVSTVQDGRIQETFNAYGIAAQLVGFGLSRDVVHAVRELKALIGTLSE